MELLESSAVRPGQARSQLRHRPTIEDKKPEASTEFIFAAGIPRRRATLHPRCQD
jgi:hypothetical protein